MRPQPLSPQAQLNAVIAEHIPESDYGDTLRYEDALLALEHGLPAFISTGKHHNCGALRLIDEAHCGHSLRTTLKRWLGDGQRREALETALRNVVAVNAPAAEQLEAARMFLTFEHNLADMNRMAKACVDRAAEINTGLRREAPMLRAELDRINREFDQ